MVVCYFYRNVSVDHNRGDPSFLGGKTYFAVCLQYADLMKKRKIVLNDKAKIHTVIDQLDKKKNEAVRKAWEQVDKVSEIMDIVRHASDFRATTCLTGCPLISPTFRPIPLTIVAYLLGWW